MSDLVFQPYFEAKAIEAISVFRTMRKEDLMDDVLDPEFSLISEAFDDVTALQNYQRVLIDVKSITMEECGFIASHINSIERKYHGVIDFRLTVTESQGDTYRSALVAEAVSKGMFALITAVVLAIIGIIGWITGKKGSGSSSSTAKSPAVIDQKAKETIVKITETSVDLKSITDGILKTPDKDISKEQLQSALEKTQTIKSKDANELVSVLKKVLNISVKKESYSIVKEEEDNSVEIITVPGDWLSLYDSEGDTDVMHSKINFIFDALNAYKKTAVQAIRARDTVVSLVFFKTKEMFDNKADFDYYDVVRFVKKYGKIGTPEQEDFFKDTGGGSFADSLNNGTTAKTSNTTKPADSPAFKFGPLQNIKVVFKAFNHENKVIGNTAHLEKTQGKTSSESNKSSTGYKFTFWSLGEILEMSKEIEDIRKNTNYIKELERTEKNYFSSLAKIDDFAKHVQSQIKELETLNNGDEYDKKIIGLAIGRLQSLLNLLRTNIAFITKFDETFKTDYIKMMAFYTKMASECSDVKKVKAKIMALKFK